MAAAALGVARRALDEAVSYAGERTAFGQPISQFQGVGFMLAGHGDPGRSGPSSGLQVGLGGRQRDPQYDVGGDGEGVLRRGRHEKRD